MRVVRLSIRRYRAFEDAAIPLSDFTVLTGPNNLGKSTVLRALNTLFGTLQEKSQFIVGKSHYDFDNDYPKHYIGRPGPKKPTLLSASFEFSTDDINAAKTSHGLDLPSRLDIKVEYKTERPSNYARYKVISALDPVQMRTFQEWFGQYFSYVYIPAVRDAPGLRGSLLSRLVEGAISAINQSRKRVRELEKFYEDVKNQIAQIEKRLGDELRSYLPSTKSVRFVLDDLDLLSFISVKDVEIDDGAPTSLKNKGDGVKHLFAMSAMQYIARQKYGKNLIFGIEEPESHLHASAVYDLKATLRDLSKTFQVVITTHSPILIQRDEIAANIIVEQINSPQFSCSGKPAQNMAAIRESLGIRPQDNMTTAEVVLVVEGLTEELSLPPLLGHIRKELTSAFASGRVRVLSAKSAQNVIATIRALARDAASCVVLLDNDDEGRLAAERIRNSGLVNPADLFLVPNRDGCLDTEYEDLFDSLLYVDTVSKAAGIVLTAEEFEMERQRSGNKKTRMKKWTDVMRKSVNAHGKNWEDVKEQIRGGFGRAINENSTRISATNVPWAASIAARIFSYLTEKGKDEKSVAQGVSKLHTQVTTVA